MNARVLPSVDRVAPSRSARFVPLIVRVIPRADLNCSK